MMATSSDFLDPGVSLRRSSSSSSSSSRKLVGANWRTRSGALLLMCFSAKTLHFWIVGSSVSVWAEREIETGEGDEDEEDEDEDEEEVEKRERLLRFKLLSMLETMASNFGVSERFFVLTAKARGLGMCSKGT